MASGNRVEELEARVKQLEASGTGLTDELVECKERLRALEDAVDPDVNDIIEGKTTRSQNGTQSESEADKSPDDKRKQEKGSDSDEIIVA